MVTPMYHIRKMRELTIDQMKPMMVEILNFFDRFCVEHNLEYFLTGGTLLGAIRHKGFIPWDDDIDINMPRNDYEQFISSFYDPTGRYKVVSLRDKDYYLASAKVIDTATVMKENYEGAMEIGLFIDIFPMDNLSDDIEEARKLFKRTQKYRNALLIKNLSYNKNRNKKKNVIIGLGKVALMPFSRTSILRAIDKTARVYEQEEMTSYIGTVATAIYGEREILKREWYQNHCEVEFEGNFYFAPVGYDEVLKQLYGDYMKLPPIEKQQTHHDNKVWVKE